MKSVMRLTLTGAFLMAVLSTVPVASASAAECPGTVEGGGVALCSEGHEQKGTFAFTGQQKSGSAMTVFHVVTSGSPIVGCASAKLSKGSFIGESGGKLKLSGLDIEYEKCEVESPASCVIASSLTVNGGGPGLGASLKNTSEVSLVGDDNELEEENRRWTDINIKSKSGETCPATWEGWVKGKATCKLPSSTTESVTHVLECVSKGKEIPELTFAGYQVEFVLTAELKLASGKKWSLQKV